MSAPSKRTVIAVKSAFLQSQTRVLSQPLDVPALSHRKDDSRHVPEKLVKDAIKEVNRLVRRHNRAVYSALAIRHVSEQIDALYWKAGEHPQDVDPTDMEYSEAVLREGDDLTLDRNIAKLPEKWDSYDDEDVVEDHSAYADSLDQLREMSNLRTNIRSKIATYKSLSALLEPLSDPIHNIQPNIVTRDGPLAEELTRCRALAVRVGGRLGDWERSSHQQSKDRSMEDVNSHEAQETTEDITMQVRLDSDDKLRRLLDDWR